jgi:hypothetical protein
MRVKVNTIFTATGRRRTADEIRKERPFFGELSIEEVKTPQAGNPKLVAKLRSKDQRGEEPQCAWLYDPQIGTLDRKGFYLRGFSVLEDAGRKEIFIHMQVWWVRQHDGFFDFAYESKR